MTTTTDYYEQALADLKRGLPIRTETQSFDWWDDLFCAPDPRNSVALVIVGDTITDKVNKKSGKVVECFVMPWRDSDRYREWVAAMRRKWNIDGNAISLADKAIISDIHYGGFVITKN